LPAASLVNTFPSPGKEPLLIIFILPSTTNAFASAELLLASTPVELPKASPIIPNWLVEVYCPAAPYIAPFPFSESAVTPIPSID
jgi:hypothetical protein